MGKQPVAENLACPRCGHTGEPVFRRRYPHIGAWCAACNAWLRWIPKAQAQGLPLDPEGKMTLFEGIKPGKSF